MPQLDKVTFLSQFFWLCFFYLGFYYVVLKFYLPKISRILALRRKKMGFSGEATLALHQEHQGVRENYELVLSRALVTSKSLFNTLFSRTTTWLHTNATTLNQTHFQNVNASYVHSLGETSLSQNMLFYHAGKNLPEKLALKTLFNTLHTLSKQQSPLPGSSSGSLKIENGSGDAKKMKKSKK